MQGTQYATKRSILCRGAFCGPTEVSCFKEVCSPYAQLLPWQHTLYISLTFIRTVSAFDCIICSNQFESIVRTCKILKI